MPLLKKDKTEYIYANIKSALRGLWKLKENIKHKEMLCIEKTDNNNNTYLIPSQEIID